jgi:hypothetical protein
VGDPKNQRQPTTGRQTLVVELVVDVEIEDVEVDVL